MAISLWPSRLDIQNRAVAGTKIPSARVPLLRLTLITFLAVLIHGYHLGVDDSEIYIPAIKRAADPSLYPYASEFFESHAHLSIFPELVGESARITRMPVDWMIFLWHVAGVFLLLLACWRFACACFETNPARWSAVGMIAGVLSVPVAGTALILMDPYLTARSFSTPATVFAIASYVSNKPRQTFAWLLVAALIHPQMGIYCAGFLGCLVLAARIREGAVRTRELELLSVPGLAFLFDFAPAHGAAREALFSRSYFFVTNWTWYEWIGVFAPLALLWVFSSVSPRGTTPVFRSVSRTLVPFGLLFTAASLVLAFWSRFENLTRLQPMRAFHLLYVIFFLLLGGLLGEYALQCSRWRWIGLFVPLAALMAFVQWRSFPHSSHVEWPGNDRNAWTSAFLWVRDNTPKDAVFALDPDYMLAPDADLHGFRAIAERSALAENVKDSGVVALFPQLADQWERQVTAQSDLRNFQVADFENLAKRYPVTWIVSRHPKAAGLICPYENHELSVCRIDTVSLLIASVAETDARKLPVRLVPTR
jgi:hypothetical protein